MMRSSTPTPSASGGSNDCCSARLTTCRSSCSVVTMCCLTDWGRSLSVSWGAGATRGSACAPVLLGGCHFAVGAVDLHLLAGAIELDDFNLVEELIAVPADFRFLRLAARAGFRCGDRSRQGGRGVLDRGRFQPREQLLELLVALLLDRAGARAELVLRQLL